MYLKIQQKLRCLGCRKENKVEFLEGRFFDEKPPRKEN